MSSNASCESLLKQKPIRRHGGIIAAKNNTRQMMLAIVRKMFFARKKIHVRSTLTNAVNGSSLDDIN
tara:strand:- start:134 stop:334 length:201 start_codon:yes stop_codon:yes gene_type:complete